MLLKNSFCPWNFCLFDLHLRDIFIHCSLLPCAVLRPRPPPSASPHSKPACWSALPSLHFDIRLLAVTLEPPPFTPDPSVIQRRESVRKLYTRPLPATTISLQLILCCGGIGKAVPVFFARASLLRGIVNWKQSSSGGFLCRKPHIRDLVDNT
jgi:hypothetical protein